MRITLRATATLFLLIVMLPNTGRVALAQSLGTYLPSVYSDTASQPLPVRVEVPSSTPLAKRQALLLQKTIQESHRPYISNIFAFSDQPLRDQNYHLNTLSEGIEAGFYPNNQTKIQFDFLPTLFGINHPTVGHLYQTTIRSQPTDRFKYYTTIGLFQTYDNVKSSLSVVGNAGASYAVNDRLSLNFDYSRSVVGNSRLSAVGLNLPGTNELVGAVKSNAFSFGPNIRLTRKTDLNFRYVGGFYTGENVKANPFQEFNVRLGRTLIGREEGAHLQFLQPSVQFLATGFRYDESGFGNAAVATPNSVASALATYQQIGAGIANNLSPGQKGPLPGGYFSPKIFYETMARMDAGGRITGNSYYKMGVGLGPQIFKTSTQSLANPSLVATGNLSLSTRLTDHITMEQGYLFLQAGNVYTRHVVYNQTSYHF